MGGQRGSRVSCYNTKLLNFFWIFFLLKKNLFIQIKKYIIIINLRLLKIKKDKFTNNIATLILITYNNNMTVPINMTKYK
jgi:hypothetical protein